MSNQGCYMYKVLSPKSANPILLVAHRKKGCHSYTEPCIGSGYLSSHSHFAQIKF